MELLHVPYTLPHFLFMGCWNKDGCASPNQAAVARALRKEPADWPLFLGGDNIYPDKVEKRKTYPVHRIGEGLACLLRDAPRTIYATLGNHNIATREILDAELAADAWTIRKESYCLQFKDRAVLMLNSNALDVDKKNATKEENEAAKAVLDMLHQAVAHLYENHIPYILIMHHPIVSYKKLGFYVMPRHEEVLDILVRNPPQMVLVADTHNYQQGILEWKGVAIRQIVAGTGGAELDTMNDKELLKSSMLRYTLTAFAVAHGYVRVIGEDVKFVEVQNTPSPAPKKARKSRRARRARKTRKN